jgi:hypothetical protein
VGVGGEWFGEGGRVGCGWGGMVGWHGGVVGFVVCVWGAGVERWFSPALVHSKVQGLHRSVRLWTPTILLDHH